MHNDSTVNSSNDEPSAENRCAFPQSINSEVCSRTIPVRLRSGNAEIVCYALSHISFHVTLMKSDCVEVGRVEGNLSVGGNAHCVW